MARLHGRAHVVVHRRVGAANVAEWSDTGVPTGRIAKAHLLQAPTRFGKELDHIAHGAIFRRFLHASGMLDAEASILEMPVERIELVPPI